MIINTLKPKIALQQTTNEELASLDAHISHQLTETIVFYGKPFYEYTPRARVSDEETEKR